MTTPESAESFVEPTVPIESMPDWIIQAQQLSETPGSVYESALVGATEQIKSLASGELKATPAAVQETVYGLALTRLLYDKLAQENGLPPNAPDRYGYRRLERVGSELDARALSVDNIRAQSQEARPVEVLEYFVSKLERWQLYLEFGDLRQQEEAAASGEPADHESAPTDTVYDQTGEEVTRMRYLADTLGLAVPLLASHFATIGALRARVDTATAAVARLGLAHDKPALAINFGSLNQKPLWQEAFVPMLVEKLHELKQQDTREFRRLYHHATRQLRGPALEAFAQQLPLEPAQPRPDSVVTYQDVAGETAMIQTYEERSAQPVVLTDGSVVELPTTHYAEHTALRHGTLYEYDQYGSQLAVDADQLDETQRTALETAIAAHAQGRLRTETLAYFKRLALWPTALGNELYTVMPRDTHYGTLRTFPDHHGFVTSEADRSLDFPVQSIEHAADSYLVATLGESGVGRATYRDPEVNFFVPDGVVANAFWVSGTPRAVVSATDPRLAETEEEPGYTRPRFFIVPIQYYQVAEDKTADDYATAQDQALYEKLRAAGLDPDDV
jgi:hypothetical protein